MVAQSHWGILGSNVKHAPQGHEKAGVFNHQLSVIGRVSGVLNWKPWGQQSNQCRVLRG